MTRKRRLDVRSWLAVPATLSLVLIGACGSGTMSAVLVGGHGGSATGGSATGGDGGTGAPGTGGSASGGTGVGGTAAPGAGGSASGRGGVAGTAAPGTGGSASGGTGVGGAAGGSKGGTGGAGSAMSWIHGTNPFPNSAGDNSSLLVTPSGDIYVGRSAGLAKSSDHGNSWTTVTGSNWPVPIVPTLGLNSMGEIVAAVGLDTTAMGANVGAFRYSGGTWTKSAGITAGKNITQFVLDKTGALMAVTAYDGDVWRSTDNGTSFTKVAPHVGGTTSASAGALWTIAKAPNGDLYTGGEMPTGLYRSTDNGTSWTASGLATPTYKDNLLAIVFNRLGDLLVSRNDTGGNGLQRYSGGAWTASASGITAYSVVRALLVNPSSGTAYASAQTSAGVGTVYISTNDGQSWQPFASGLATVIMPVLAIGPDGILYTVTRYGEFYRTSGAVP